MELQRAIRDWHPGKVERPVQLRLVAEQQQQRIGPLDDQLDPGRPARCAFDVHLHAAEFRRVEPDRQMLGRAGLGRAGDEGRQGGGDLSGG